jgi:hypothetical protein
VTGFRVAPAHALGLLLGCACAHLATFALAQVAVGSPLLDARRLEPGGVAVGSLHLVNQTDLPQRVQIDQADIFEGAGGRHPPGSWLRSIAPFLRVGTSVSLLPREARTVPFTITLPADADGTYFGVILVTPEGEERPATIDGATQAGSPALTLREVVRYAVEVVVDAPGLAAVAIGYLDPAVEQTPSGPPAFAITAHNGGGRWAAEVHYRFDLYDAESGSLVASIRQQRGRLYPGAGHRLLLPLPDLEPGNYRLLVIADADTEVVFAAIHTLSVTADRSVSLAEEDAP